MIHLEDVTKDNYRQCLKLSVSKEQSKFVANNAVSLSKAYAYYKFSKPMIVYYDKLMIGFILLRAYPEENTYIIDQFMIDENYQSKGYGKQAMKLAIEFMKKQRKYNKIILCYIEGDEIAKNLYEKLGFYHTGQVDEDEIIMELRI